MEVDEEEIKEDKENKRKEEELKAIEELPELENKKDNEKEEEIKIDPDEDLDIFSLTGSEDIYKDIYLTSKKRRQKITLESFAIYKNKIYSPQELKTHASSSQDNNAIEFQEEKDSTETMSLCSQCSICQEIFKIKNNINSLNDKKKCKNSMTNINKDSANPQMISLSSDYYEFPGVVREENYFQKKIYVSKTFGGRDKKKEFRFYISEKNPTMVFSKVIIDTKKQFDPKNKRRDSWYKYFEVKYGKKHRLGMHFHKDKETGKIYGYQNRHLELAYVDKKLEYYCVNKNCGGTGKFDCEDETFDAERSHTCGGRVSVQQMEIVNYLQQNEDIMDVQVIRVFKD